MDVQIESPKGYHPTNTKHHFLFDTILIVATIELTGNFSVSGLVLRDVCVQQIQWNATNLGSPYPGANGATGEWNLHYCGRAVPADFELYGQIVKVVFRVPVSYTHLTLPTILRV